MADRGAAAFDRRGRSGDLACEGVGGAPGVGESGAGVEADAGGLGDQIVEQALITTVAVTGPVTSSTRPSGGSAATIGA